jgi:hypothetical protein
MPATVTSKLIVTLTSLLSNSVGLATASAAIETGLIKALASGVGADQMDRVFSERAKSISAAYDVDLSGALLDALGAAFVLVRAKLLVVIADPTNSGTVIVGGDANGALIGFGAAAHTVAVRPGGALVLFAPDATGYPITGGTGDILQFAPSAGTQLFDWAILGASA